MVHKNITVYGFVQGVGFRFSTRTAALSLNIKGFVKNLPDGRVYIEAEGEVDNIATFLKWCRNGPSRAIVKNIEIEDCALKGYLGFEIR